MFARFGEFDSCEELNRAAEAQKAEGDRDAIYLLAKENGIDEADADDFLAGFVQEFATPMMAALGKLKVETEELKLTDAFRDWADLIGSLCAEDEELAKAVRKKGKRLEKCLGACFKKVFDSKIRVNDRIVQAAGLNPPIYGGSPGKRELCRMIYEYYMEKGVEQ